MNSFSLKKLLTLFPIIKLEIYNKELCLIIKTNLLNKIFFLLKNHFKYQFKILSYISGVDNPKLFYRFKIIYDLLSIQYNIRLRIKLITNELIPINSLEPIFKGANWWECEIWDMFGIFFNNNLNLIRLLTDYGFEGYPLRKDFPLSGFYETKYSQIKHRIIYSNLELCQEYRTFNFSSPWN
jgi:NADH dehydrogenase (ubiquinone) Fe-S protein 3